MTQKLTKRQAEILATAIGLISQMGIQKLTMKKIASGMGVSEPALYRHFDSKVDILLSILEAFRENTAATLRQVIEQQAPAPQKIEAMFTGFLARFAAQPDVAAVIFAEEIFQDDSRLSAAVAELMRNNQRVVLQIVEAGQACGELRDDIPAAHLMTLVVGALRLTVTRWRMSQHDFDVQIEGRKLWSSIERLIRNQVAGSTARSSSEDSP